MFLKKEYGIRMEKKKPDPVASVVPVYLRAMRLTSGMNTRRIFKAWEEASGAGAHTLKQFFRAGSVQNHPAVHQTAHLEAEAGGQIGLDDAGDDVGAGTLGGHDDVDSRGASLLGDAGDIGLDVLFRLGHHDIRQFVHDNDQQRQFRRDRIAVSSMTGSSSGGRLLNASRFFAFTRAICW